MRLLVDTNRLTDAFRGDDSLNEHLDQAEEVIVSFVSLAELQAGFIGGTQRAKNEAVLHRFLTLPGVRVLYADRETTRVYAQLFAQLRRAGTPIPTNDLWIASLAVEHNLTLVSRDAHFDKLPQVQRQSL